MRLDSKFFVGLFFCVMDLVTFLVGIGLLLYGIRILGSIRGGGATRLIAEQIGRISGINLNLAVFLVVLVGLALVLAATGYALKALQDAKVSEGGAKDTVRHFSPLLVCSFVAE